MPETETETEKTNTETEGNNPDRPCSSDIESAKLENRLNRPDIEDRQCNGDMK
jgi:hypothetical protein